MTRLSDIIFTEPEPFTPFKNLIINGDACVNEISGNGYTLFSADSKGLMRLDCWESRNPQGSASTEQANQDTSGGGLNGHASLGDSIKVTTGSAMGTTLSADEYGILRQCIEGYSVNQILDSSFSFSFWIKSHVTGTFYVSFTDRVDGVSYLTPLTINAANTWEYKKIEDIPSLRSGSVNLTGAQDGTFLKVQFCWGAGTNYNTSTTFNQWTSGFHIAGSNQTYFGATTGYFSVTDIQLEAGRSATIFERRPYPIELQMCKRYWEYIKIEAHPAPCYDTGGTRVRSAFHSLTNKRAAPTTGALLTSYYSLGWSTPTNTLITVATTDDSTFNYEFTGTGFTRYYSYITRLHLYQNAILS